MAGDLPVWTLLLTIANAIIEVFLLSIVGYYLARRGIIDTDAKRKLNKIVSYSMRTPHHVDDG
jgi:predicted permease